MQTDITYRPVAVIDIGTIAGGIMGAQTAFGFASDYFGFALGHGQQLSGAFKMGCAGKCLTDGEGQLIKLH